MAISFVGASTPRARSNSSHVIDMPAGVQAGDYVVLHIFNGSGGLATRATPSGYVELENRSISAPPYVSLTYGKIAGSSEGSVTFSASGATAIQGWAVAFRGVDATTSVLASNNDAYNVNSASYAAIDAPATTVDASWAVQFACLFNLDTSDGTTPTLSPASGWTLDGYYVGANVYPQSSAGVAHQEVDIADGTTTSPTWVPGIINGRFALNTIVLKPATVVPPTPVGIATIDGAAYEVTRGTGAPMSWAWVGYDPGEPDPPPPPPPPPPGGGTLNGLLGIHAGNLWIPGAGGTLTNLQRFYDDGLAFDLMVIFFSGGTTSASNSAAWGQCLDSSGSLLLNSSYAHLRPEYLSVTIPLNWPLSTGAWPVYSSDGRDNHDAIAASLLNVVAAGYYDSVHQYQADAIANAYPDSSKVIVRIGHEFTNNWGTWSVRPESAAAYVAAFRHVHDLFQATLPNARFDWCDLRSFWESYGESAYPGDDYVDICGIDIYWRNTDGAPITGTKETSYYNTLLDHYTFAASKGKQVSYPEWSRTGANESSYIDFMYNWMSALPASGAGSLAYQSYFSFNTGEPYSPYSMLDLPAVYARYKTLFQGL